MNVHTASKKDEKVSSNKTTCFAIVGNMNVGKSTFFSRICGGKVSSSNVAGSTVWISSGKIKGTEIKVFDTPGILSIFSDNEDERASRDILLPLKTGSSIDGIVLVADAKNLKRSIAIALQYAEYGLPMLIDINMIDEAPPRGIEIDHEKLSGILGIDVFTSVAREGIGLSNVISGLKDMEVPQRIITYPPWVEKFLDVVAELLNFSDISTRAIGLLLLAGDRGVAKFIEGRFGIGMLDQLKELAEASSSDIQIPSGILLTELYNNKAGEIIGKVQKVKPQSGNPFILRFGDWCTQLSTGIPIVIGLLYLMYLFVGSFGASFLVDTINGLFVRRFSNPFDNENC